MIYVMTIIFCVTKIATIFSTAYLYTIFVEGDQNMRP